MSFDWFLTFFERIFNFFAILIANLNKPFNEIFYSFKVYNPFNMIEYTYKFETSNETINNVVNEIMEFLTSIVNALLSGSDVDVSDPTWVVLLTLLPGIFAVVVIIKFFIGLFKK